jgi:hypothetical protein
MLYFLPLLQRAACLVEGLPVSLLKEEERSEEQEERQQH